MNGDDDDEWLADAGPADDDRVLHGQPAAWRTGLDHIDYVAVITTRDDTWWAGLSDNEYAYIILRALESASERGAPLHLARCAHHLHALLSGLDSADYAWVLALLQRMQALLARRTTGNAMTVTLTSLLAYLSDMGTDPRFAPPSVLTMGLLHRLYPHGVSPATLQEAMDRERYPHGMPLPPCPVCEAHLLAPSDMLVKALAALSPAQHDVMVRLGRLLALDGAAPDVSEQIAWVRGTRPVPARYHSTLTRAQQRDDDTLQTALAMALHAR